MNIVRPLLVLFLSAALVIEACSMFKPMGSSSKSGPTTSMPAPSVAEKNALARKRQKIVDYAKEYIGIEYHYAGTSPKTGFDCSGFTSYVMKEFKIDLSPASVEQAREGIPVALDKVQPGDLIIFGDKNHIQHVGLVTERNKAGIFCIHSTNSRGIIIDNISTSAYWKPLILYARDVVSKG